VSGRRSPWYRIVTAVAGLWGLGLVWVGAAATASPGQEQGAAATGTIRGTVTCHGVRDCTGAVVYVVAVEGRKFPPGPEAVMDQKQLTFVPHILPVVTGTTVAFLNSDGLRHNVFSSSEAKRFNLGSFPQGVTKHVVFDKPGVVELLCNVHSEMSAFIIVTDTPYAAVVGPDGRYVLERVPTGTHTVVAWHEQLAEERRQVVVPDGEAVETMFTLRR